MAKIATNTIGRMCCAPGTWACSSSSPKADAVAPATIPRGAIQATNARSRRLSPERQVASATASGRITRTMMATSASAAGSTAFTSDGDTDAEMSTNRAPIRICTSVPWNSSISDTSILRWLARAAPISVVATKPASSRMRSAPTRAAATIMSTAGTAWRGTVRCVSCSRNHRTAAASAPTAAPTRMLTSISPGRQSCPLDPAESAAWKTMTPSRAPIGSTSTPSHISSERTRGAGRTNPSSGSTTVGPETTSTAPMSSGTRSPRSSKSSAVAAQMPAHVTTTPTVTSRPTVRRTSFAISRTERRRPASNRISPTASDTNGW